jgi:hypothetical protein
MAGGDELRDEKAILGSHIGDAGDEDDQRASARVIVRDATVRAVEEASRHRWNLLWLRRERGASGGNKGGQDKDDGNDEEVRPPFGTPSRQAGWLLQPALLTLLHYKLM